ADGATYRRRQPRAGHQAGMGVVGYTLGFSWPRSADRGDSFGQKDNHGNDDTGKRKGGAAAGEAIIEKRSHVVRQQDNRDDRNEKHHSAGEDFTFMFSQDNPYTRAV